jgi:ABC-type transport system substrate-binding protein
LHAATRPHLGERTRNANRRYASTILVPDVRRDRRGAGHRGSLTSTGGGGQAQTGPAGRCRSGFKEILKHATPDDPTGLKWLETKTIESGPFVIDNWEKGTMMSLVPNPHSFEPPKKEPFNNLHFRRAIAWAIPYDTLLQVVTRGLAQRLRSCVSLNISGYMEEFWPYETNLEKAREELAQAQVRDRFSVTVPVSAGDAFDEESIVLIKESLAQLGIQLTLQKMSIGQKRTLLVKKQIDMAIYDFRPLVPDVGYYIYWNWLPDSLNNYWGYGNPEAQELGSEVITMAVESPGASCKIAAVSGDYQWGGWHDSTL